jgi:hypothetical protein
LKDAIQWTKEKQCICLDRGFFVERRHDGKAEIVLIPNTRYWPNDLPPWYGRNTQEYHDARAQLVADLYASDDLFLIHMFEFVFQRRMTPPRGSWTFSISRLHWTSNKKPRLDWYTNAHALQRVVELRAKVYSEHRDPARRAWALHMIAEIEERRVNNRAEAARERAERKRAREAAARDAIWAAKGISVEDGLSTVVPDPAVEEARVAAEAERARVKAENYCAADDEPQYDEFGEIPDISDTLIEPQE